MEQEIKKFLEFQGKKVYFLSANGVWWIAIKPICEALGVDYIRQFKNTKNAKIIGELLSEQTIVAADGKLRKMVCLPERVVYGWIFKINSDSPGFEEFQWKCFDLLFDYFHGTITERKEGLKEKTLLEKRLEAIDQELAASELYKQKQEILTQIRKHNAALRQLDKDYVASQLELWQ